SLLATSLSSVVLIDVRNRDEAEKVGQIPGSHCLPLGEIEDALQMEGGAFRAKYGFAKPAKEHKLVIQCTRGNWARKAAKIMADAGIEARIYPGSFLDWKAQGGEVVPGKPFQPVS
ncbi:rhodanese domain-containing protein CG4456-like, partial [Eriocheir sinensis]|uniref:rhodanese domain-containing protein CG4456-like n=1 Tax=Eriocheir sinensis TaxID=95602 RepID=UPI0021CAA0AC